MTRPNEPSAYRPVPGPPVNPTREELDMTTTAEHMRVTHLHDQVWAALRQHRDDIRRIADDGLRQDEHDQLIVRMVFNAVAGDIDLNAYESQESQP